MTLSENLKRIHPLVAVAAVSVTLFSAVGIAAITGVLPNSRGANRDLSGTETPAVQQSSRAEEEILPEGVPAKKNAPKIAPKLASESASKSTHPSQVAGSQQAPVQGPGAEPAQRSPEVGVAGTQTAHKPVPQNSPVGIGVGAVIGGVLGSQIGSGDGKTLATILGAVGGGYVGNEVAKKNQ